MYCTRDVSGLEVIGTTMISELGRPATPSTIVSPVPRLGVGWRARITSRSPPVADRVRAAFVGAGNRAFSAHYPAVRQLADEVELAAVCEVDPTRLARGADYFGLPAERRYDDL